MMFCPKCGSMLKPKIVNDKKVMACSCGYVDKGKNQISFSEKKSEEKKFDVIEKEDSAYSMIDEECPKCKNPKAFTWSQQMRAGDEPETTFFKCSKCAHTWREGK